MEKLFLRTYECLQLHGGGGGPGISTKIQGFWSTCPCRDWPSLDWQGVHIQGFPWLSHVMWILDPVLVLTCLVSSLHDFGPSHQFQYGGPIIIVQCSNLFEVLFIGVGRCSDL